MSCSYLTVIIKGLSKFCDLPLLIIKINISTYIIRMVSQNLVELPDIKWIIWPCSENIPFLFVRNENNSSWLMEQILTGAPRIPGFFLSQGLKKARMINCARIFSWYQGSS